MGFSSSNKHSTTASTFSNVIDAASGSFTESLTVSGIPVVGRALYIYIRDEKSSGTQGGTFTSGAWRTRTLNTIVTDETGAVALSSDQFTLPAGTYVIHAKAPAHAVSANKIRLQNITDATTTIVGENTFTPTSTSVAPHAFVEGKFTITSPKAFEIQHRGGSTSATLGFGVTTTFGVVEVYASVVLFKTA